MSPCSAPTSRDEVGDFFISISLLPFKLLDQNSQISDKTDGKIFFV